MQLLERDIPLTRKERNLYKQGQRLLEPNKECIKTAEKLCQDISYDFQLQFLQIWNPENKERSIYFSDDSVDYMLNNDFLIPHFKLITDNKRGRIVEKMKLKNPYRYRRFCNFNLRTTKNFNYTHKRRRKCYSRRDKKLPKRRRKGNERLTGSLNTDNLGKYYKLSRKRTSFIPKIKFKKKTTQKRKILLCLESEEKNTNVETD